MIDFFTQNMPVIAAMAVFGYLLGSIPFGLVITRLAGLGDIRDIGSGNIGATNVLRTGRKDLALATLLLDAGKAGLAFFAGQLINREHPLAFDFGFIAGVSAFFGHCFPVWLKFKGGKGVATFVGLLLSAMWPVGLAFGGAWLLTAAIFRMSSLAALVGAIIAPAVAWRIGYGPLEVRLLIVLTLLIFYLHRANIARLLAGKEPKMGGKKKSDDASSPPASPS